LVDDLLDCFVLVRTYLPYDNDGVDMDEMRFEEQLADLSSFLQDLWVLVILKELLDYPIFG
jgi:hypothetical protein